MKQLNISSFKRRQQFKKRPVLKIQSQHTKSTSRLTSQGLKKVVRQQSRLEKTTVKRILTSAKGAHKIQWAPKKIVRTHKQGTSQFSSKKTTVKIKIYHRTERVERYKIQVVKLLVSSFSRLVAKWKLSVQRNDGSLADDRPTLQGIPRHQNAITEKFPKKRPY